jgi:hypothetical protein
MTMVVITGKDRIRLVQHEHGPCAAADSSPDIIHESHQGSGIAAELLDFTSGWDCARYSFSRVSESIGPRLSNRLPNDRS